MQLFLLKLFPPQEGRKNPMVAEGATTSSSTISFACLEGLRKNPVVPLYFGRSHHAQFNCLICMSGRPSVPAGPLFLDPPFPAFQVAFVLLAFSWRSFAGMGFAWLVSVSLTTFKVTFQQKSHSQAQILRKNIVQRTWQQIARSGRKVIEKRPLISFTQERPKLDNSSDHNSRQ